LQCLNVPATNHRGARAAKHRRPPPSGLKGLLCFHAKAMSFCDGDASCPRQRLLESKAQKQNPLLEYISLREAGHGVALSYWCAYFHN